MKITIYNIIIIIIILIIINLLYPTYYPSIFPSIPIYPDNNTEVKLVENYIKNRTKEDIAFFYKTNNSVAYAFLPYVNESIKELNNITYKPILIITFLKFIINRARPNQINKSIKPIDTSTGLTPAFPAGHAYQAYYLAKNLSKKYPDKKNIFNKIAYECDLTRIKAGLHYPSDGKFSKLLVDKLH